MQPRFKALSRKENKKETNGSEAGKQFFATELPHFPQFPGFPGISLIALTVVISIFDGVFRLNNFWCEFSLALQAGRLKSGLAMGLAVLGQFRAEI